MYFCLKVRETASADVCGYNFIFFMTHRHDFLVFKISSSIMGSLHYINNLLNFILLTSEVRVIRTWIRQLFIYILYFWMYILKYFCQLFTYIKVPCLVFFNVSKSLSSYIYIVFNFVFSFFYMFMIFLIKV